MAAEAGRIRFVSEVLILENPLLTYKDIHLIDFQVISRTGGKRGVLPYEATSLQDVVWLDVGETVRVIARFAPWPGLYMFHWLVFLHFFFIIHCF
jgi:hypothetical protein